MQPERLPECSTKPEDPSKQGPAETGEANVHELFQLYEMERINRQQFIAALSVVRW